jgi:hypothetical protein
MSIERTSFSTIFCDIPSCKDRLTASDEDVFFEKGWETVNIFDKDICLCPYHTNELKEFLFHED